MNKLLPSLNALAILSLLLASCLASPQTSAPSTELPATVAAATATATAIKPSNLAAHDFSSLPYTEAFDKMFEIVRRDYAFNGVKDKQPDWDAVYASIRPRVERAETDHDPHAWFFALRDFTLAFKDGRVNLGGDMQASFFQSAVAGGYGFALRELDNGRAIVAYVTPGGPAAEAGIRLGAQVTVFNGQPISSAIEATKIWGAPPSLESSMRYQKSRYLTRAPLGTEATIEFSNPGEPAKTVTLVAVKERESFAVSSVFLTYKADSLPVEFKLLPSGLAYIRITSTADQRELVARLFESALKDLETANVPGLILDLRVVVNLTPESPQPPLGLAGFLANEEITLGQLQYFDAATGKFEDEGLPQKILPRENRFHVPALALLVGPGCSGTCEVEAYAFSQLPGVTVIGQYPTAGVVSDITRGGFLLPEGFLLQIPTGRYVLPDGSLFLEGQGVSPTVRVPVDEATVLSNEDAVLNAAERFILDSIK